MHLREYSLAPSLRSIPLNNHGRRCASWPTPALIAATWQKVSLRSWISLLSSNLIAPEDNFIWLVSSLVVKSIMLLTSDWVSFLILFGFQFHFFLLFSNFVIHSRLQGFSLSVPSWTLLHSFIKLGRWYDRLFASGFDFMASITYSLHIVNLNSHSSSFRLSIFHSIKSQSVPAWLVLALVHSLTRSLSSLPRSWALLPVLVHFEHILSVFHSENLTSSHTIVWNRVAKAFDPWSRLLIDLLVIFVAFVERVIEADDTPALGAILPSCDARGGCRMS